MNFTFRMLYILQNSVLVAIYWNCQYLFQTKREWTFLWCCTESGK